MFRLLILTVIAFLTSLNSSITQSKGELMRSVYLVGNAANVPCDAPILVGLRNLTAVETAPFTVLYSGDIIDDDGLEAEDCEDEEEKLRGLIEIGRNNPQGSVLFIPGERDWDDAGEDGLQKIRRLEAFLEKEMNTKRALVPTKGCPGPMVLDIGEDLRIIAVNTQWFLHRHRKPEESDVTCEMYDIGEFWDEIDDYMEEVPNRNIIIAAHHPAFSYGQYAGYRSLRQHLFPLTDKNDNLYIPMPVLGSFYAGYRRNIGTVKDLNNREMQAYLKRLERLLQEYRNIIYVSAHELDLQALLVDKNFHINSGSVEKARSVAKGSETLYKSAKRGFIKLEYRMDGAVTMKVYELNRDNVELAHEQLLQSSPCIPDDTTIQANDRYVPCRQSDEEGDPMVYQGPTHVTIAPGSHYDVGKLKRWVFGEHYRKTWSTPVSGIPVLDLDTTYGGLVPFAIGGGGQTHVLKFQAANDQWYYFRSVDKDPSLSLSNDARLMKGWYGAILKDLTSGQYPYGKIVTDKLMDAAGIYHSSPQLYLMPDHPKLGTYQEKFGGMLGYLELRPRGNNKGVEGFKDAEKVVKTVRMFQHLLEDNDHHVDAASYGKARLFDILVSDWDRQADNWKFMAYGKKKSMTFYAMPKDRDRAFSKWEGIYWLLDREFGSPKISNFGYKYGGFKSLTFKARQIDRMLLNEVSWDQWQQLADSMQADLTDEAIDAAVAAMPAEAQAVSGDEIAGKLKYRRDQLMEATLIYYRQLARNVDVIGSNKREIFEIERLPDGDVMVEVYKKKKSGEKDQLLYSRLFHKDETKEIRLYGLAKEDEFYLKGEVDKSILIRIITGDDPDLIVDRSGVGGLKKHSLVYDKSAEDTLQLSVETRVAKTKEAIKFTYRRYEPNAYFPLPSIIYNQDDGFGLGFGLSLTRQGFNKPNYAKKYYFKGAATTNENYWLEANAEFRHVVRQWDLQIGGSMLNSERRFRQFYGIGNKTVKDNNLKDRDYYENHTNAQYASIGLKRDFWRKSGFTVASVMERYYVTSETGADKPPTIYQTLPDLEGLGKNIFLGSLLKLKLDLTDALYLPTRGVKLQLDHRYLFNLYEEDNHFGRLSADLRFYETIQTFIPVTIGLRGGHIYTYGEVPFFYLARLGQNENLRGYLRNRFTGERATYVNADLRFDLGTIETVAVPLGMGVISFYDAGRVKVSGEDSDKWHTSFGGGIYLAPINENFNLTMSVATSKEEKALFQFSFGFML